MRVLARVLGFAALFGAAALPHARAVAMTTPVRPDAAPAAVAPSRPSLELPPPRVVDFAPQGERVALDAPLVIRFDRDVPQAERAGLLSLSPPVAAEPRWLDGQTLELGAVHWRPGHAERVGVSLAGARYEWLFRTRYPMPLAITPGEGARIVLSFDDGPNDRRQADRLLDELRDLGVRALFFPTGRWASTRPDWVERAVREGHRVCNHTKNHVNLTAPWMTEERIRAEIAGGAGDGQCRLFRPPLMGFDERVARIAEELGYELFLWDLDSRDWEGGPAEDLLGRILSNVAPDRVVLLHMHAEVTLKILGPLVERLREADYVTSWDPADAPNVRVGRGAQEARAEWLERLDRRTDAGEQPEDPEENH